ncbi:MAG: transposon-transfer assisting family protein [Lachnospiraceae bacterium]|nr:transposon-transfer assisting family protein [Lachnospiraceae bacterium]
MKDSQTKRILGFYDEHAEYVRNDRYSDSSQTVYTRLEDKYHWLVAKPQGKNRLEVHQTDEHGMITARDTYESQRNTFNCVDVERLQADGKHRVHFSEDEINLVYQYGEGGKDDMLAILHQILPRIKDPMLKDIVTQTADKVSSLAPEVCSNLISSVKNRKIYERDCSIRERLSKAKAQSKQSVTNERKNAVPKRGEQSL